MRPGKVKGGDDMGQRLVLTLLMLSILVSGCVSKPQETKAPVDVADAADDAEEFPDIEDVTEEELVQEPELDINDTVDLGSLL
jgi:PBP1b-binding outer membrane lipoprotein LpoB